MIINQSLIVSNIVSKQGGKEERVITIKKNNPDSYDGFTKLAHIYSEMPFGLIHKEETGIGATTLELQSKRNSIIVEPTRVTASSKAKKHDALYIGGKTKTVAGTSNKDILSYLNDVRISPKKIIVVADSLHWINDLLKERGESDYFFMIDEIDSFQLDSSFRKSMENCLDIYKTYPIKKRAMVTATSLKFSDPLLTDDVTILKYDQPTPRTINIFYSIKIRNAAIIKAIEILKQNPADKLMIAFNSVNGCYDIAKYLVKNKVLAVEEIKILCSTNSKEKVEDFFTELETDELPAKLNFCTSAYFTGFDINERYHLISISSITSRIHTLSEKRLKQIAGRCRDRQGVLSETIIHDSRTPSDEKSYSIDDCIAIAKREIGALNCISHNYEGYPLLKENIESIRKLIVESTTIDGYRFVRFNTNKESVISYLNIDAFIEQLRVRNELYKSIYELYDSLQNSGHNVEIQQIRENFKIEKNDIGKAHRLDQMTSIIETIKNLELDFKKIVELQNDDSLTGLQKYIVKNYIDFKEFLAIDKFLSLIGNAGGMRDKRKLNNIILGAYYFTLDPLCHYKRTVTHHIPIGPKLTSKELRHRWNLIFLQSGIHKQLETDVQAIRLTRLHYHIIKKKTTPITFFIKKENPLKLSLIKNRPHHENEIESLSELL